MTRSAENEQNPPKESLIGKSPFAVLGKIMELNPQVNSLYFCALDPKHYLNPSKDSMFHTSPIAYGELNNVRPLHLVGGTIVGKRLFWELLLENGTLTFLNETVRKDRLLANFFPEIETLIQAEREQFILGVMSAVKLDDGSFKHIPMIDFSSSGIGQDLEKAKEGLRKIGERKGFILNSGRGLHYYGTNLLSEEEWPKFIGRCLLLNLHDIRIVDHRYMGHRLIDGFGCLRIASHSTKPSAPTVIEVFEDPQWPETTETEIIPDFLAGEKRFETMKRSGKPLIEL